MAKSSKYIIFFPYNFGSSLLKYKMSQTTLSLPFLSAWILEDGNLYFDEFASKREGPEI